VSFDARRTTTFALAFVTFMLALSAWSLATPLFSAPDEPAHIIKAASVVGGDFMGTPTADGIEVRIPTRLAKLVVPATCQSHRRHHGPDCYRVVKLGRSGTSIATTPTSQTNPFYYAAVGLPLRWLPDETGIHLVRLLSACICSALMAWAIAIVRRRTGRLAVLVAVTPGVMFLASSVNPIALEISAAILMWAAALALVRDPRAGNFEIHAFGVGAACVALARPLGYAWILTCLLVAVLISQRELLHRTVRSRLLRVWIVVAGAATYPSFGWMQSFVPTWIPGSAGGRTTTNDWVQSEFYYQVVRTQEIIGAFGWNDIASPSFVYGIYLLLYVLALGLMLAARSWRVAGVILGMSVLLVSVPAIMDFRALESVAFFWQGRYNLALAVSFPMLTALAWPAIRVRTSARDRRTAVVGLAVALSTVHVAAFWGTLVTNERAAPPTIRVMAHAVYRPEMPALACALLVLAIAMAIVVYRSPVEVMSGHREGLEVAPQPRSTSRHREPMPFLPAPSDDEAGHRSVAR
jgi:hypothetical protein